MTSPFALPDYIIILLLTVSNGYEAKPDKPVMHYATKNLVIIIESGDNKDFFAVS